MSKDVTYHIAKGHLYKDIENDGHTFMRHGAWSYSECLCTIEEAKEKYPPDNGFCVGVAITSRSVGTIVHGLVSRCLQV